MGSLQDAATWLLREVGVGGVFTKVQLRAAFPEVTQIDRRVRDLRAQGWVIHTRRQDPSLGQEEMRLVEVGDRRRGPSERITPKQRRAALLATAHSCLACGAVASAPYPDARDVRVQLKVLAVDGQLRPICLRCEPSFPLLANREPETQLTPFDTQVVQLSASAWARLCRLRLSRAATQPQFGSEH